MNGYQLTDAWFEFRFQHPDKVSHAHTELYFYLVYHWNKLSQKEKFGLPSAVTMEATGIRNYKTYRNCIKDLAEFGFIRIISEAINQHQAMVVAWGKNTKADTEALTEALTKAQHEALPHIGELSNYITKELKKEGGEKKVKEKKKFIAPSIEEVQAYFEEKGFPIDLVQQVYSHYADADWTKANGVKVIDWKRTIDNNWQDKFRKHREQRLRQNQSNASSYNSQLPVDASQIVNYGKGNGKCFYDKKAGLWYEPLTNGYLPKEISDYYYYDQGNHSNYGDYVRWMIENDKTPMPPEDTRYFPEDWNFEKYVLEQRAIVASSNL
jgi:hypothetical protein